MIHHQHKCIFIHITKTAGSSITKSLGENDNGNPHRNAFDYLKELGEEKFNEYYKFAVVRNPWERMVSEHHYQTQRKDGKSIKKDFSNYLRTGHINQVGNQLDWIAGPRWTWDKAKGDYTNKSDETKLLVDDVLRFETLSEDIKRVSEKLGIDITLPVINTSKHDQYRSYYNDITHSQVLRSHKRDIDYFKYKY